MILSELAIDDATEPSDLLWDYIGASGLERSLRIFSSWVLASVVMLILYLIILELKKSSIKRAQQSSVLNSGYVESSYSSDHISFDCCFEYGTSICNESNLFFRSAQK